MKRLIFIVVSVSLLFSSVLLHASDWKQIEQPLFTLIFKPEIESEAIRVADKMNQYLANHLVENPLNQAMKPISIVLYNEAQTSNGAVGIAPYGSFWFNRPSPMGQLEWFDILSVHEGRHMVQMNQPYDVPLGKALHFAFGETGIASIIVMFIPAWYMEGDAVVSETTMTNGGRGRTASFELWLRGDTLAYPSYSYERAMIGTGQDRVPYMSPYVMGYFLAGHIRNEYGSDVFDRAMERLLTLKGFNFNGSIRQETGKDIDTHYDDLMIKLRTQWQRQIEQLELTPVTPVSMNTQNKKQNRKPHWRSFYPISVSGDSISAVEIDIDHGARLVEIQHGELNEITDISSGVSRNYFGGAKTRALIKVNQGFCWVKEIHDNKRPLHPSGDLVCNTDNGLIQKTNRLDLTSVGFNGEQFMAHQFDKTRSSRLLVLNDDGKVEKTFELPSTSVAYDITPADGGWLYVLMAENESGIYFINDDFTTSKQLVKAQQEMLRSPIQTQHWLLFTSDRTGIDQVMAQSLESKAQFQIVTRPLGSYYLNWDSQADQLVFADYTATGQQLVRAEFTDAATPMQHWIPEQKLPERNVFVAPLIKPPVIIPERTTAYKMTDYSVLGHVWNPHSWRLLYDGIRIDGLVQSRDVLGTLSVNLESSYYVDDNDWSAAVKTQYQTNSGRYLMANLERKHLAPESNSIAISGQIRKPYLTSRGPISQEIETTVGASNETVNQDKAVNTLNGQLKFSIAKEGAFHRIDTPLAFSQSLYADIALETDGNERMLSQSALTLPGLHIRHALNLNVDSTYQSNLGESLLQKLKQFQAPGSVGVTTQARMDYRMNMGGIGLPITALVYLRDMEVSLNTRLQSSDVAFESALGITLKSGLNLFRNLGLRAAPSASVFYRIQQEDFRVYANLTLLGE